MNDTHRQQVEELFQHAVSLPIADRSIFLDQNCPDPATRAEVEKLLAYDAFKGGGLTDQFDDRYMPTKGMLQQSVPGRGDVSLPASASTSSSSIDHGRFLPGTVLSDRYRIVGMLGKGGMGEVYRADDLELGQSVALKFLPKKVADDPRALERFRGEVRLARQVSHPNVCRVYDIGQIDGQWFLSMEYVDGEDLAQLLRRIGRFPQDRATELARQLCLGLHAAHEKGVLHRDLKPANIMIDGRGKLLITDFGLAEIADDVRDDDIRSGTPAYMSPEQLAGREVTERSDIYSLGIILHEIYTGKPVWQADSMAELFEKRKSTTTPTPTSHVGDLDPLIERVIKRCLEPVPESRPVSAVAVVAGLPGGDPLQAALAAGEIPSPQMVAAAGDDSRLNPTIGWSLFFGIVVTLIATICAVDMKESYDWGKLKENEPAVLRKISTDLLATLGVAENSVGTGEGFGQLADRKVVYWYRSSPISLEPVIPDLFFKDTLEWQITLGNPLPNQPGMTTIILDSSGRLLEFLNVPLHWESDTPSDHPTSETILQAIGIVPDDFSPEVVQDSDAVVTLPVAFDTLEIWSPDDAASSEKCVLAFHESQCVYIRCIASSDSEKQVDSLFLPNAETLNLLRRTRLWRSGTFLFIILMLVILSSKNIRNGTADISGATKCAVYYTGIDILLWLCVSGNIGEPTAFLTMSGNVFARSFSVGLRMGLYYIAMEPFVRQIWPSFLSSWSRMIAGRFQDRLVGRDILIGLLLGAIAVFIRMVSMSREVPEFAPIYSTMHGVTTIGNLLHGNQMAIGMAFVNLMFLMTFKRILKSIWIIAPTYVAFWIGFFEMNTLLGNHAINVVAAAVVYSLSLACFLRFGFLAFVAYSFVELSFLTTPMTADVSAWYSQPACTLVGGTVVIAAYCLYTSTISDTRRAGNSNAA